MMTIEAGADRHRRSFAPLTFSTMKMHEDQRDIDVATACGLIAEQFPLWAGAPVTALPGIGTVNAVFRIGDRLTARFPLTGAPDATRARLEAEASAMQELRACSPFPAPAHVAFGEPGAGFDLPWSVQTWLAGEVATSYSAAESSAFASELATLIRAFRAVATNGRRFSGAGRGGELRGHDAWMAECIARSSSMYDAVTLTAVWDAFRILPREHPDVMTHGDLTPVNVLSTDGRLAGLLDTGGFGPADPALELVGAWHLLDAERRSHLRRDLEIDDVQWLRGAAWAFEQAMGLVWYYRTSNPVMAEIGRVTMHRLLGDPDVEALHRPRAHAPTGTAS